MVTITSSLCDSLHCQGLPQADEEVSSVLLEQTMRSQYSEAQAKTSVHTCPPVAHGICRVGSVNVCMPEKNGICTRVTRQSGSLYTSKQSKDHGKNYPTHDLELPALFYALDIYGRIISVASCVKFISIIKDAGKF